jgi:acyl-CoA synthetase (AMP-forming)/AMP-acid ligase II
VGVEISTLFFAMRSVYNNIFEILTDSFSPALILPDKNYKLYYSSIRHAYEALQHQPPFCNIRKGDIVTVSLPNSVDFIVTMFTVFAVRATFNPIKVSYQGEQLIHHLRTVMPKLVITSTSAPKYREVIHEAAKLGIPVFLIQCDLIELRFRTPKVLRQFSPIVAHHVKTVRIAITCKSVSDTDLSRPKNNNVVQKYDRNDIALLLHTHGTTGPTKLVPLSHGNVLDSLELTAQLFELSASDTSYLIMAMYHSHGLIGVLLSSLFAGSTVLLATEMSIENFWRDVLKYRVTWYSGVPLFHKMLMNVPKPNLENKEVYLRFVQSCGYHLESRLVLQLEQYLRVPIITSYTMTEASHLVSTTIPNRTRKLDSVGQPVGVSVRICDESGKKLINGLGEICLSGPMVFKGRKSLIRILWGGEFKQLF